jgi:hypothetical protein
LFSWGEGEGGSEGDGGGEGEGEKMSFVRIARNQKDEEGGDESIIGTYSISRFITGTYSI